jgi:pimeloyl-ACP methyl ester carboxylesterase
MIEEKEILIDNLKINYKIAGHGPAILILHGWGGSSHSWSKVQEILAQDNFEVICPDFPGFGKSQNPPKPWGIDDYVNFLSDFVRKLNLEKFFLVAHSFGGGLAARFLSYFPEKVKALILCNAVVIRPRKKFSLRRAIAVLLTKFSSPIFSISFFKRTIYPLARKIVYKIAGTYDYYLTEGVMRETFKRIIKEDSKDYTSQIKVPTLIVWGKEDKILSLEDAILMKKLILNSKLEIIEKADHNPHRKAPEELAKIILKFLEAIP